MEGLGDQREYLGDQMEDLSDQREDLGDQRELKVGQSLVYYIGSINKLL